MKLLVLTAGKRVILLTIVVLLEVGLKPLAELKVVQVLSLDELGNVDVALDSVLVKGLLEDLVVVDVLVLGIGVPLDPAEGEGARVEGVKDGAVDGPGGALLNLGQLELQVRVEPVEDVLLAHEVGLVHHANRL